MSENPPTERPTVGTNRTRTQVIVNTGDGKGKSTAAFGVMIRALARGWKVAVVQFIKSGDWKVGEEKIARSLGVDWWAVGDGFSWDSEDMEQSKKVAREGWKWASGRISSGDYDLVILDEVTYPITWGWFDVDEVITAIRDRPDGVNLVLTGRDAAPALIEVADTVTEMRKVKHAFDAGIPARRGLDY